MQQPGLVTGITVHDHCPGQGLPELLSETEIGLCNYQREGTTFVDSFENYPSTNSYKLINTNLSPAEPDGLLHFSANYTRATDDRVAVGPSRQTESRQQCI